jgi:tRNA pseudouridine-54 N-methylase
VVEDGRAVLLAHILALTYPALPVALLKKALALPATTEWAISTSGIFVRTGGLAEVLADLLDTKLIYLRQDVRTFAALVRTARVSAAFPVRWPSSRETTLA